MNAYIICIIILVIAYVIFNGENNKKNRKRFSLFAFLILLFLHCLKNNDIYPDIIPYEDMFFRLAHFSDLKSALLGPALFEPVWTIITYLFTRIFSTPEWYLHFISFFICAGYSLFCYRYSKSLLFSFLFIMLYPSIFNQSFYVLRQHLASVILLFSLPYIEHRNLKKFLLCVFSAFLIHYSAIVMLPLYYIYKILNRKFSIWAICIFFLIPVAFRLALSILSFEKYSSYANSADSNMLPLIFTGSLCVLMFIVQSHRNKNRFFYTKEENSRWLLNKSYIIYSFMISIASVGSSLGRLSNYFIVFSICAIPYLANYMKKGSRFVIYLLYFSLCILLIYTSIDGGYTILNYSLSF